MSTGRLWLPRQGSSSPSTDASGRTAFGQFCAEVLLHIFESLEREELRALRLVRKATHDLAAALLFSHAHLSPTASSVPWLSNISQQSHLAYMVQVLECRSRGIGDWVQNLQRTYLPRPDVLGIVCHSMCI